MTTKFLLLFCAIVAALQIYAQQPGDIVSVGDTQYAITSDNLISNPGFENGFTGWTDASSTAAELSSDYFNIIETGGINDTKYLVGNTNSGRASEGSIGTGWNIEAGKTYYFSYNVKYENTSTSAGPEIWLKTSLTNNKTSDDEPLILIDTTWVEGGGAWTHNAVGFTNTDPSYSYIVARFRWLGGRLGFDNFGLYEATEIANTDGLQTVIDEALALYNPAAPGAAELQQAITSAQSFLTSSSADEVTQAIEDLNQAIWEFKLLNASSNSPLDFTSSIINPSFEDGFEGWTNNGLYTQSNSHFTIKHGNTYAERWVNRGSEVPDVNVAQHLSEIPNGKYVLTVATMNIQQSGSGSTQNISGAPQTGTYIFAGDDKTAVDTMKNRSIAFYVFDGQVDIGFKTEGATGNWVTCDNFRLEFMGFDIDETKAYLQEQVDIAKSLLEGKLQDPVRSRLNDAITASEQQIAAPDATRETLASAITALQNSITEGKVSNQAYVDLQLVIDEGTELYGNGEGNEAEALQSAVEIASDMSVNYSASTEQIYDAKAALEKAILAYRIANATGTVPAVVTHNNYARGATMIFGRSSVSGVATNSLLEIGFCWSTQPEPTILDNRTTKYYSNNGNIYCMDNLEPSTVYYIRAYAITTGYAVGYGNILKVITIPKGTVTYTLASNVYGDHRTRIDKAMEEAVGYYNNLTSIRGHWLNVNYGSGTPTAEASYGGYMRFGPNTAYQKTGTALHEMGHTIGVGTHSMWYGTSSPLRETGSRGLWLGDRTKKLMEFIENDSEGYLTGDHIHMWPYGINGANEDNGSEILYIINALIIQALGEDGLPPTGGFATPAYTFEITDNTKYYLKSEDEQTGLNTSYIVPNQSGNLVNRIFSAKQALANDSAAWHIEFNPTKSYYTFKNVATGKYLTYKGTGYNGISTVTRQSVATADFFHLMQARIETTIGEFTRKGYWIIHPESKSSPATLAPSTFNQSTLTSGFNISNSSTKQRWLILSDEEVEALKLTTSVESGDPTKLSSGVKIFSYGQQLRVENISLKSDIKVFDISGSIQLIANNIIESYSHNLPKGIYIVAVNNGTVQVKKKIIIQ